MEDGNLYLRLRKMSHTIYAANGKVSHIHRRMCEWDYTIDKSLFVYKAKEGRDRRGRDRMIVGFTTTCAISAYHH
jgi:hypothetical protein